MKKILFVICFILSLYGYSEGQGIKRKSGGDVKSIIAGTGATISPSNGKGNVTITVSVSTDGLATPGMVNSTFTALDNSKVSTSGATMSGDLTVNAAVTASSFTVTNSTVVINGVHYNFPSAQCSNGQVLKIQAGNQLVCSADDTGGSSNDTIVTTFTKVIGSDGLVYTATTSLALIGNWSLGLIDTMTIVGMSAFSAIHSTVAATADVTVRYSTGAGGTWDNVSTSTMTIAVNTRASSRITANTKATIYPREQLAISYDNVPTSGDIPHGVKVAIEYFIHRR